MLGTAKLRSSASARATGTGRFQVRVESFGRNKRYTYIFLSDSALPRGMTSQVSATDFNPPKVAPLQLTMQPECLCGPPSAPVCLWTPARYIVEDLPAGQRASIYLVAGGWNIKRIINGIEFRQYKPRQLPEEALCDLQLQIDEEAEDLRHLSPDELQRRMKRYRLRP